MLVVECHCAMILCDVCLKMSIRVGAIHANTEERAQGKRILSYANAPGVTRDRIATVGMVVLIV